MGAQALSLGAQGFNPPAQLLIELLAHQGEIRVWQCEQGPPAPLPTIGDARLPNTLTYDCRISNCQQQLWGRPAITASSQGVHLAAVQT